MITRANCAVQAQIGQTHFLQKINLHGATAVAPCLRHTALNNMNWNKVQLAGRLTRDPVTRRTNSGTCVTELALAVNRKWRDANGGVKDEVEFFDVVLWGKVAETAEKYLTKGRAVFIDGRLNMETWDDKTTGQKRTKMKVVGEVMQFVGDAKSSAPAPASTQTNNEDEHNDFDF